MSDEPERQEHRTSEGSISVFFICDCCGQSYEIQDVEAVLRSLHLQNVCPGVEGVLR